jgi:hypothetical protein
MTHKTSEPLAATAAGVIRPEPHVSYLPPPALFDVLIEQVEYLVGHAGDCRPGCAECARLEQLKCCLLQPFQSVVAVSQ